MGFRIIEVEFKSWLYYMLVVCFGQVVSKVGMMLILTLMAFKE